MTAPAPTSESRAEPQGSCGWPCGCSGALRTSHPKRHGRSLSPAASQALPAAVAVAAGQAGPASALGEQGPGAADARARPGPRLLGAQQGRGWRGGALRQKQTEASAVARDRKPGSRRSVVAGRPALQGPSGQAREPHFTPESKGSLLGLSVRETAQFSLPRRSGEALLEPEPGRWP